jgi:hypothetical protein
LGTATSVDNIIPYLNLIQLLTKLRMNTPDMGCTVSLSNCIEPEDPKIQEKDDNVKRPNTRKSLALMICI